MAVVKRRKGGRAKHQLREIKASPSTFPLLLVHVTAVGAAREIIESGQIEMRTCKVFSVPLSYFFILRPAYRRKNGDSKSDEINRFPFVFVVSPDALGAPHHVYPFDTGGAMEGVFDDRADGFVCLDDYELESTLAAAGRHISWAFGTAIDYFDGSLRQNLTENVPQWQDVVRSFVNIAGLAASGHNDPDQRASAVEVAYRKHVRLKGNVKLAILPKQYIEDGGSKNVAFIDKLVDAGIEWEAYDWQPNKAPDDFKDEIARITRAYYKKIRII